MTRALLGFVLATLAAYGLWEAYPLIAGPALTITAPAEGASYPDGVVAITGRASRTVALTLDGHPLLADQGGRFETTFAFPHGGSILTFTATDRFGRSIAKERMIYVP